MAFTGVVAFGVLWSFLEGEVICDEIATQLHGNPYIAQASDTI